MRLWPLFLVALPGIGAGGSAIAQQPDEWRARKCALYAAATEDALALLGQEGLRPEFLARNRAFIAAGCGTRALVCAETPEEYALADLLTVMTMNEGMASTFVPFGCAP